MSKRKYRRGCRILSLDELARQEVVFWVDKPTARGWFMSWQFRMVSNSIGNGGVIFYAMPSGVSTRFTDEEIIRAERRLHTKPTIDGRTELIRTLNDYDRGAGDVDDVIDQYENSAGY